MLLENLTIKNTYNFNNNKNKDKDKGKGKNNIKLVPFVIKNPKPSQVLQD
jgi:hypothetical protein